MAQPIFGFSAGGLHFLFPYLANRRASSSDASLRRPVLIALGCNVLFVAVTGGGLLWLGQRILHLWAGATVAQAAEPVLPMIVWSSALLGLNVTATYALLSMGSVRVVTAVNLAGGALMLVLMFALTPRFGIQGIALARLVFSLLPLALYLPLFRRLYLTPADRSALVSLEPVGGKP
jgi:O-antigen/teichoic acid export membrane protein